MNLATLSFFFAVMVTTQLARADDAEDIREQLTNRWFEVELIVFERLGTFDFNTVEKLTSSNTPRWPTHLVEYGIPKAIAAPQPIPASHSATDETTESGAAHLPTHPTNAGSMELFGPDRLCVGYPVLPEMEELHPVLQSRRFQEDLLNELLAISLMQTLDSDDIESTFTEAETSDLDNIKNISEADSSQTEPSETIPLELATVSPDPATTGDPNAFTGSENTDGPLSEIVAGGKPSVARIPQVELPEEQPPTPVDLFQLGLKAWEQILIDNSFTWSQVRALDSSWRAINRQSHFRPLFHQRWTQRVPERGNPLPIRLDLPDESARLQGTIGVTVARYLHLNINLWYQANSMAETPRLFSHDGPSQPAASDPSYMYIRASRRMRSEEMHYIDHPMVGIVAYIDPVSVPEDLLRLWQLQAEAEALD